MKLRVTIDDQIFEVELGDLRARPVLATIAGETFEVWPDETEPSGDPPAASQRAALVEPAPASLSGAGFSTDKARMVLAPIPGVILSVNVKEGDTVNYGQELCLLEAMKMKNQIRANRAGVIAAVCIAAGDQVKHGQVLMEYTH